MIALRANDGSATPLPYTPLSDPGFWQPTPPAFAPAILLHWAKLTPFGLASGDQFRSDPPPALTSGRYRRDYDEVKEVGDVNSTKRPQDRDDVARFFAVTSAMHAWNQAAVQVSAAQGTSLSHNARAFAILNMAINDGLIASIETKYFYHFWRPVTAIRAGDTDGNPRTEPDPAFTPFITTPAFPSYPSAHASASYAARECSSGSMVVVIIPSPCRTQPCRECFSTTPRSARSPTILMTRVSMAVSTFVSIRTRAPYRASTLEGM